MTILAIGLWGSLTAMNSVESDFLNSDFRVVANQLAAEKMERIIADKAFRGYQYLHNGNYPNETLDAPLAGYRRWVTFPEVNPDDLATSQPGSGVKLVTVVVAWGGNPGFETFLASVFTDY
jgi:hypothetical protein